MDIMSLSFTQLLLTIMLVIKKLWVVLKIMAHHILQSLVVYLVLQTTLVAEMDHMLIMVMILHIILVKMDTYTDQHMMAMA
ncbi:MAG: hypothetical protein DRI70_02630, partial [Bacteroidetes bacterium]